MLGNGNVGSLLGNSDGISDGTTLGLNVGTELGTPDGNWKEGSMLGISDGISEVTIVGKKRGETMGIVGNDVGGILPLPLMVVGVLVGDSSPGIISSLDRNFVGLLVIMSDGESLDAETTGTALFVGLVP